MNIQNNLSRRKFLRNAMATSLAMLSWPAGMANAQTIAGLYDDIPIKDEVMGDPNAPVTLLEYASMTCPHCKAFHENILPAIKERYVDAGKVKYILRPFPFNGDRRGEAAFMLAKCAPNNKYYAMLDALFSTQSAWARGGNPVPELLRISKLAGMTEASFKTCLGNQKMLNDMIAGRNLAVRKFKVTSTPTLFINNEKFTESASVENLSKALDGVLGS